MPKYKDESDYLNQSYAARDKFNVFPARTTQAGEYSGGWNHAFRTVNGRPVAPITRNEHGAVMSWGGGPGPAKPHAPGEAVAAPTQLTPGAPVKPNRTLPWQRGLVHGMMWRRRNPWG